jgi:formylglycine-generating enzyme required for sulfatase activity
VTVYPENRYVVTSRPPGYESAPLEHGFTVLRVRDFTGAEIRQFATNWCLAVELAAQGEDNPTARRRAREAAGDLVAAIEANAAIRKLAVNPLLLSIIALVHRYRARLPRRRVDLYAECVDVLLGHWDAAKGLVGDLSPGQKRTVLQPLALALHRDKRRELSRRELERRIAESLPAVGGSADDATDFVDEVRERSGLLVEAGLGTYTFSHLTFQEYLCAREMVDREEERGLLLAHTGDEWWQEVTQLYAGMAEATPIVEALLATEGQAPLLLAGRCVAEAVRLEEGTREQTLRLLQDAFATCTGERFMETGLVLAEIAGEDDVGFFLRLARDDAERRPAALSSLGQMGRQPNEALRERVVGRLLNHFQGDELRQEAGVALVYAQDQVDDQVVLDVFMGERNSVVVASLADASAKALDRAMVEVPAGKFLMGDEKQSVHVDAFQIDKYPVTNAQYKRFLDANPGHSPPRHWAGGTYPAEKATHPVVYVNWHDAVTYAEWAGKRLPTEQEWEKAARGTDGRVYPWGDQEPTAELCNFGKNVGDTTPVGRYSPQGDSPYGCVDMAGNVWEWTASDYGGGGKVLRGGAWGSSSVYARSSDRFDVDPGGLLVYIGLRCVVAPTSASL